MEAKVFISCGQKEDSEKRMAEDVRDLLEKKGFNPYLAFKIQSLDDIMTITKELSSSDYYLFIDFFRNPDENQGLPCSLFTHQELALAHHLGFRGEIIALQQEGVPREGFLKYVLCEKISFNNETDLIKKVSCLMEERGWTPDYSRNLVIDDLLPPECISYTDHTGGPCDEKVYKVKVCNRRQDVAAVRTICILDRVQTICGDTIEHNDRSYLKWAKQKGYEQTILPKDFGLIDIFAIRTDVSGLFLHSLMDIRPRKPILADDGDYLLSFKLFSQGFPLVECRVKVKLRLSGESIVSLVK